jgi:hypothetical protein
MARAPDIVKTDTVNNRVAHHIVWRIRRWSTCISAACADVGDPPDL